ncbi:MAG: hypothetical protein HY247_06080 [archaeon]|nr:MAG: hypothetical protein HY247_06080 [archaeon]
MSFVVFYWIGLSLREGFFEDKLELLGGLLSGCLVGTIFGFVLLYFWPGGGFYFGSAFLPSLLTLAVSLLNSISGLAFLAFTALSIAYYRTSKAKSG